MTLSQQSRTLAASALATAAILLCSITTANAGDPGEAGYLFLTVGTDARAEAMGGAHTGVADGLGGSYYNPAALADAMPGAVIASYTNWVTDIQSGFVAGALLAGAATMPPGLILTIFGSLGVGMAAPYLVLSAKPSLVERIPRTGPASELVKQVMGLLLIAAAAYFVGAGLIALVSQQPWLARQLHWWTVALFATLAGLWLLVRTIQITKRPVPRVVFSAVGLVVAAAAILYAGDSTSKARQNLKASSGRAIWILASPR